MGVLLLLLPPSPLTPFPPLLPSTKQVLLNHAHKSFRSTARLSHSPLTVSSHCKSTLCKPRGEGSRVKESPKQNFPPVVHTGTPWSSPERDETPSSLSNPLSSSSSSLPLSSSSSSLPLGGSPKKNYRRSQTFTSVSFRNSGQDRSRSFIFHSGRGAGGGGGESHGEEEDDPRLLLGRKGSMKSGLFWCRLCYCDCCRYHFYYCPSHFLTSPLLLPSPQPPSTTLAPPPPKKLAPPSSLPKLLPLSPLITSS